MTVAQAAQFLSLQRPNLRKLLGEGRIKGFRVGGEWRVNPSDLLIDVRVLVSPKLTDTPRG